MNIFKNLKKVFTNKYWLIWVLLGFFIMSLPTYFFTWWSRHNIIFWEWDNYFYFILALDISLAIFFAIFLWATLYKMKYFSNKKVSKLWFIGGFIWSLVWWCASCTLTFATYLGLSSILAFLPYHWVELKLLSIVILIYVCFITLKNLEVCNLKFKKS